MKYIVGVESITNKTHNTLLDVCQQYHLLVENVQIVDGVPEYEGSDKCIKEEMGTHFVCGQSLTQEAQIIMQKLHQFNTGSNVSLPLLATYLNAGIGRITSFLQIRRQEMQHREGCRGVPDSINAQGLPLDPDFRSTINILAPLSDAAFTEGRAGMRFGLRPKKGCWCC